MGFYAKHRLVETREFLRDFVQESAIAISAIDCLLLGRKAPYASSAMTTGARFYDLLRRFGLKDGLTLREKMGEREHRRRLWDANVDEANRFARSWRDRLGGEVVISPAPYTAPGWSQPEYLHFWETLIRTRVGAVYFNHDWHYSNGCAYEFAVACDAGVPVYDADGRPLTIRQGRKMIEGATSRLEREGFGATRLRSTLGLLTQIEAESTPPN